MEGTDKSKETGEKASFKTHPEKCISINFAMIIIAFLISELLYSELLARKFWLLTTTLITGALPLITLLGVFAVFRHVINILSILGTAALSITLIYKISQGG